MTSSSEPQHASFGLGVRCLVAGMFHLLRTPATWPWAIIPVVFFFALWVGATISLTIWLEPGIEGWLEPDSALGKLGATLVLWAARLVIGILALWFALAATPSLTAPALEHLVQAQEVALGAPPRLPLGIVREISCGLRAQALAIGIVTPVLIVLWLLEAMFPPSVVLVLPLKFVLMSLGAAWSLLDYPLTLRGIGIRARLRLIRFHPAAALGFGATVALAFWIPCGGILLLPAAVLGATRLVWTLHAMDPTIWPELGAGAVSLSK